MNIEKWKKAVVQLECAVESDESIALEAEKRNLFSKRIREEITEEQYHEVV